MSLSTRSESERELGASRRLLQVTERELQRILLDVHDGPVQYMYAALSQLELLRRAIEARGDPVACAEELERVDRIRRLLEDGLNEVRSFIGAFRPPEFEWGALPELLESLILQHETTTDTDVRFEVHPPVPAAALPVKIALYRVLQEGLSNAYRHGGAARVVVRLSGRGEEHAPRVRLEIEDDGAGFDPALVDLEQHFGLGGMRDRAEMMGGTFTLCSAPGGGTTVAVEVPAG